jgi:hypothetical protein
MSSLYVFIFLVYKVRPPLLFSPFQEKMLLSCISLSGIVFYSVLRWDDLFCAGIFIRSVDRFNEQSEHGLPASERSNVRPLLDENDEGRASEWQCVKLYKFLKGKFPCASRMWNVNFHALWLYPCTYRRTGAFHDFCVQTTETDSVTFIYGN